MNINSSLNIDQLAQILNINNSNTDNIKKNEVLFIKYKTFQKFAPFLLEICCDINKKYSPLIELNASIQLKNFINSYWKFTNNEFYNKNLVFDDEIIIIINDEDKNYIRNNIIDAVIYIIGIENIKILKQLNQCIKKILKFDFETLWKDEYIKKILTCFNSNNEKQIYAGIILFHQLSKLFEYENNEKQVIYNKYLLQVNEYFLSIIQQCKDLNNQIQVQFIYKILKIFFKSFQNEITPLFLIDDNYEKWSNIIITIIKNPISNQNIQNKKNIFWKLKTICFQIITKIYKKFSNIDNSDLETFKKILIEKYIPQYFQIIKTIFENCDNNQNYINDYCLTYIYDFFANMLSKKNLDDKVLEIFINNNKLKEQLIKDSIIQNEDLELWINDPKNYINKQMDNINFYFSKRFNVYKVLNGLMNYRKNKLEEQNNPPDYYIYFLTFLSEILKNNSQSQIEENKNIISKYKNQTFILNPNNIKYNLIKEAVLYLIESNEDLIMKYSKDMFEDIIENYILNELSSPIELMREKSMKFIISFKNYKYKNENLLNAIMTQIINLLQNDNYLQVKIYSVLTSSCLINQEKTHSLLKGNIKNLLSYYLQLMEETDLEDIIESVQNIIKEFKEETKEFIVQLSDYLIKYFNKLIIREDDKENEIDNSSLINNLLSTFTDIIHYFINNNEIYVNLEQHIIIILDYCFKKNIYEQFDNGIELLEEIIKNSNSISKKIWNYFIPLVTSVIGTEEELKEFKKEFPNQIYEGFGFDSINRISKILKIFIFKESNIFFNSFDNKGKKYIDYILDLVKNIIDICEANNSYIEIKYAFDLISLLFEVFKGKVDIILNKTLNFIFNKHCTKNEVYNSNLKILLSSCFIYNSYLTLKYYESVNQIEEIFKFWFEGIDKLSKRKEIKYNLIGICYLISLDKSQQNKLIFENMKTLLNIIITLAKKSNEISIKLFKEKINENYTEEKEENDNNLYNKLLKEDIENDDDNFDWYNDEIEEEITQFDKENEVLFLQKTLNNLSLKSPEEYNKITELLGKNNINILQSIFTKETKNP